ncbi:MAG: hypothetical protein JSV89_00970 [Spirochaetaceae bacterium]|nr:MAG: hypothetical protein JSV89_00970 [Spirochaetaceae bacterium]
MLSTFGLVLGLLALFLAACNLFLAPRCGRFNPSDSNADPAEHLVVDRASKEDVYVDTAPSMQFDSGSLY